MVLLLSRDEEDLHKRSKKSLLIFLTVIKVTIDNQKGRFYF